MEAQDCNPTVQETGSRELCKFSSAWVVWIRPYLNTAITKHGGIIEEKEKNLGWHKVWLTGRLFDPV